MKPTQPKFFSAPFAQNGDKNTIPEATDAASGAASLKLGFPKLTETTVQNGGIPPTRKDFNGILYWLSTFCFFLQSGGIFSWSSSVNYAPPAVVYHNSVLWWCVKANGAESTVAEPKAGSAYWEPYITYLLRTAEDQGVKLSGAVSVGTIIAWPSEKEIDSRYGTWIECKGQDITAYPELVEVLGATTAPNYQGMFLRGNGSQTVNGNVYTSASLGNFQGDAIRNITGSFTIDDWIKWGGYSKDHLPTGAFSVGSAANYDAKSSSSSNGAVMEFSAANVVPTASENRPANKAVRYMIKAAEA